VSLPRREDVELIPAWLGLPTVPDDPWAVVAEHVKSRPAGSLVDQGRLLGLPLAALPTEPCGVPRPPKPLAPLPYRATRLGDHPPTSALAGLVVADLSSLWAGPLCGSLLADAGATVIKVESTARPDGARRGPPAFFDLLNAGKRSVALDLADPVGRQALQHLIGGVDVVIEASRPRALEQLGIHAHELVRAARPRVWLSITAHGRDADHRGLVGFGDDGAVAGGLVTWAEQNPYFCADAVADPTTGLAAAGAVLDALATGGRWLLDLALSRTAAHLAGPTLSVPVGTAAAAPLARPSRGPGPTLGADTDSILAELPIRQ
jgi:crotonobetainyl-CoA:carnitine CoA-transferase CaiB-like acyl-CoA transferase